MGFPKSCLSTRPPVESRISFNNTSGSQQTYCFIAPLLSAAGFIRMERFFLFCFRSCLKGEKDSEYYDVLEIDNPQLATTDSIKKQYKKLSLSLHPVREFYFTLFKRVLFLNSLFLVFLYAYIVG
jgi:hypothetical protein